MTSNTFVDIINMFIYIYIYIYTHVSLSLSLSIYIYIYTHTYVVLGLWGFARARKMITWSVRRVAKRCWLRGGTAGPPTGFNVYHVTLFELVTLIGYLFIYPNRVFAYHQSLDSARAARDRAPFGTATPGTRTEQGQHNYIYIYIYVYIYIYIYV